MSAPDPNLHRLPDTEHAHVYRDVIRPLLFDDVAPAEHPSVTILGGTPGTGKSSVARELLAENPAAKISSDKVSKSHPKWLQLLRDDDSTAGFYVRLDAVGWVDTALAEAAELRLPVLVDTALADPVRTTDLSAMFRQHDYSVHYALVAGPAAFSQIGVLDRHYTDRQEVGGARFVDQPDKLFDGVAASARAVETDALGDTITVYRRTAEVLYRNEFHPASGWLHPQGAYDALHAERTRSWTAEESQWFIETATKLASVRPEELGPGLRDRWSDLVAEAVSTAIPHLHGEFTDVAAQIVSEADGQARSSPSAEADPALHEMIERMHAGRRPAAEAVRDPMPLPPGPERPTTTTAETEADVEHGR